MEPKSMPAAVAVEWIKAGWRGFMASPGVWVVQIILFVIIAVLVQMVPRVGNLLFSLFSPALSAGLLFTAREALNGNPVRIEYLFQGLLDGEKRTPLVLLGALFIFISFLIMLAVIAIMAGTVGLDDLARTVGEPAHDTIAMAPPMGAGMVLAMLGGLLLMAFAFTLMIYAVPAVMFADASPVEAVKLSIRASFKNIWPLTVVGLIYLPLTILAVIPMGLGLLILVPMGFSSLYASYHDIFERQQTSATGTLQHDPD